MTETMQQTIEEKFREVFSVEGEYKTENDDEPVGLVNIDMAVLLLYEGVEKFGNVPLSSLSYQPDSFNYATETDKASLWAMTRAGDAGTIYYYDDEYVRKVAELLGVTPAGLEEYAYSDFSYDSFPAKFEKDGIRILVSPYIV